MEHENAGGYAKNEGKIIKKSGVIFGFGV